MRTNAPYLMMKRAFAVCVVLVALLASPARAQTPISNFVFTVGTTIRDSSNNDWAYVLISSQQPLLLTGKKFAVYGKPGDATNTAPFTLRTNLFQQTDAASINTLLSESVSLGQDVTALQSILIAVLGRSYPVASNQTLVQNMQLALQVSATQPIIGDSLRLAAGANPGLLLCLGRAFTEKISGITTYEVREINLATGGAGDVVGRVTITPGAPTILPAPGAPFQVVTNSPADDLRIRLRWGQPDALLRLELLSYGYNIWRIPRAVAESLGYDVTPPSVSTLYGNTNFTHANSTPVMATKYFSAGSGMGAADDASDAVTYFFADGHAFNQTNFSDGDKFYYFITARDLLGRDGLVSPGGAAEACRKSPPAPPTKVKVVNLPLLTNDERLMITWLPNTNAADQVSEYWVYRWPNPAMYLTNDAAPNIFRVGIVSNVPGTNATSFVDNGVDAPVVPGVTNYWYSLRAVSQSTCGPLLSPPTPPAWGVLRERAAPMAATGTVYGSCAAPAVMFQSMNTLSNAGGLDTNNWNYRFTCIRRDPGIATVQFIVTNSASSNLLGPVYFAPDDNVAQFDYSVPINGTNYQLSVSCLVATFAGETSLAAGYVFNSKPAFDQRQEAVFYSGNLLGTTLSAADPLLTAFNGAPLQYFNATAVTANPNGTVSFNLLVAPAAPALIQVFTNNNWNDLGVISPDTNNLYWISYPACLLGPLPPFRGAAVNLPGDCSDHIARAGDGTPVAPIYVRFGLTPRTREFRLYRSVDGGPLSMISQAAAAYDSLHPGNQIVRTDDSMPASPLRLGYFVQLLDEHGHGSPISYMGFKNIKPAALPTPVLGQPQAAGDTNNPQVSLSWFCPPSGVYRFAIKIARNDQNQSGLTTGLFSQQLLKSIAYKPSVGYLGLLSKRLALLRFDEEQLTPPISTNFGPGPAFNISVSVTPNVPYTFSVCAVDAQGIVWAASKAQNFTWVPPVPPELVPWPARPPVSVTYFDDAATSNRVGAVILQTTNGVVDATYPVGVRIGSLLPLAKNGYDLNVGTTNFFDYGGLGIVPNPNTLIFRRNSKDPTKNGDLLLPIVLYRQQIANSNYPTVSGHLTQVSPLIEKLPVITEGTRFISLIIPDLLIGAGQEPLPPNGAFTIPAIDYSFLYVRDQQPVIHGATYQYYAVRMDPKHEISEVINAGQVLVP